MEDEFTVYEFLRNSSSTFDLIVDCAVTASEGFGNEAVGMLETFTRLDFDSFIQG